MNPVRRLAVALAGLVGPLLALAAVAHAAPARPFPPRPPGWDKHPPPRGAGIHTVVAAGMPVWQIALIAIGAALLAATVTVLVDRARAARRKTITAGAWTIPASNRAAPPQSGPGGATAGQPGR